VLKVKNKELAERQLREGKQRLKETPASSQISNSVEAKLRGDITQLESKLQADKDLFT